MELIIINKFVVKVPKQLKQQEVCFTRGFSNILFASKMLHEPMERLWH
jgi:hypothetical protein